MISFNSPIFSPFDFILYIIIVLFINYLFLLPKRFHDEKLAKYQSELSTQLTEIKSKLDKDIELLKIIRSQVEPQKVASYLAIVESCGELNAIDLADQQTLSHEERTSQIEGNKATFILLSRFFLFASDNTVAKYIFMRKNDPIIFNSSPSFLQYADLMVSMRQDLHMNTKIDASHFCAVLGIKHPEKE